MRRGDGRGPGLVSGDYDDDGDDNDDDVPQVRGYSPGHRRLLQPGQLRHLRVGWAQQGGEDHLHCHQVTSLTPDD